MEEETLEQNEIIEPAKKRARKSKEDGEKEKEKEKEKEWEKNCKRA